MSAAPKLSSEFETERALVNRLRESMGAVRLAVQILAGPLSNALEQLDEVTRQRVKSVLQTLDTSTRQVCDMLATAPASIDMRAPAANGPAPIAATPAAAPTPMPSPSPSPKPAAPKRTIAAPTPSRANGPRAVEIDELLRRLEIVTVTRSSLPVLLAVDAHAGLEAADAGRELLPTLVGLVERAAKDSAEARPGARPWTIEIRAFIDPAEILGDEMHVVLEVRHDGTALSRDVTAWLDNAGPEPTNEPALVAAKALAEAAGGRLEALCAGTKSAVRLRLPESR